MRVAPKIELDAAAERELRALARRGRVEARVQQRAKAVLLAAQGWQNKDIAVEVELDRRQVALWRQRFLDGGIEALLHDAPRPGRTPTVTAEVEVEHRAQDAARQADRRHALEHAHAGRAARRGAHDHPPRVAAQRPEAAPARAASSSRATRASRTSCWTWWGCT